MTSPSTSKLDTDLTVRWAGRPPTEAPTLVFLHGLTDAGSGWPGAERHWGPSYALLTVGTSAATAPPRGSPPRRSRRTRAR